MRPDVDRAPSGSQWAPGRFVMYPHEDPQDLVADMADIKTAVSVSDALLLKLIIGD